MQKKWFRKILVWGMILLLGVTLTYRNVQADSTPLSVRAILPDNQFNKDVSYYHLMMTPGQKQEIELQLFNSSDKEATAVITLTAATTNDNGLLDYNLPDKKMDKSLLYPFPSIAKAPKEVKIPANKDVTAKIAINMPEESYNGMILGGINVTVKKDKEKATQEKKAGGMKIENAMNYALGVVLVENEELVPTDMTFIKVYASQVMGNNTTKVTLQNPTAAVMENVTIEAEIYAKDGSDALYSIKKENYRMAPNSNFDLGIPIGQERYKAGQYQLKLVATSDPKDPKDGQKQTWEFDETFEIKREEANKLNATAVDIPKDYTLYYIIGIVVTLLLISLISFLVYRQRKKKKKAAEKAKRRKSLTSGRSSNKSGKRKSSR